MTYIRGGDREHGLDGRPRRNDAKNDGPCFGDYLRPMTPPPRRIKDFAPRAQIDGEPFTLSELSVTLQSSGVDEQQVDEPADPD